MSPSFYRCPRSTSSFASCDQVSGVDTGRRGKTIPCNIVSESDYFSLDYGELRKQLAFRRTLTATHHLASIWMPREINEDSAGRGRPPSHAFHTLLERAVTRRNNTPLARRQAPSVIPAHRSVHYYSLFFNVVLGCLEHCHGRCAISRSGLGIACSWDSCFE